VVPRTAAAAALQHGMGVIRMEALAHGFGEAWNLALNHDEVASGVTSRARIRATARQHEVQPAQA